MGSRRAVIVVRREVVMGCFFCVIRHFISIGVVCGGSVIDRIYVSRM